MMFGGAITGALIMAFGVTLKAPHGGIFVFFAIGNLAVVRCRHSPSAPSPARWPSSPPNSSPSPSAKAEETPALATA